MLPGDMYAPPLGVISHHWCGCNQQYPVMFPLLGRYRYMASLHGLQAAVPLKAHNHSQELSNISSPLHTHLSHPDREFATYILEGLQYGFQVGLDHTKPLKPAHRNMPSAEQHPEVNDQYLAGEVAAGHIVRPLPTWPLQINRL